MGSQACPGGGASRSRQSREGEGRTPGDMTEGLPKGEDANRRGGRVGEGKGRRECPMCNFYMGRGRSCRYENELNQTSVSSLTSSVTLNKSLNFAKPQISHLRNGYNITSEESKNYII